MNDPIYPPCKKCGATHGMGIENMETVHIEPMDICELCLFRPMSKTFETLWSREERILMNIERMKLLEDMNEKKL